MADEFPTLEVVLAACVLGLGWRGVSLVRAARGLDSAVEAWASAIRAGDPNRISALERDPAATWLAPLGRAVLEVRGNAVEGTAAAPGVQRGARMAVRLRSAAARDVVVSAVLASSLVYAWIAELVVSPIFLLLGLTSTVLLLGSVLIRIRLASALNHASARLLLAAEQAHPTDDAAALEPRRCSGCGLADAIWIASPDELGPRLRDLGVEHVLVCPDCGRVEGRGRAAKPEAP